MTIKPFVVTVGEPAGISGEIILKSWQDRKKRHLPHFAVIGDEDYLKQSASISNIDCPIVTVDNLDQVKTIFSDCLPVLRCPLPSPVRYGHPNRHHAIAILQAMQVAVSLCQNGQAAGMVTAPVQKKTLHDYDNRFHGHTDYLALLAGIDTQPLMMLANKALRVVPLTVHVALQNVPTLLTQDSIITASQQIIADLQQKFQITKPRLAISALNPHAGENGILGCEEIEVISPAVTQLQSLCVDTASISGPHPADSLFHPAARASYDAVLCMYHDQALIPVKMLDFDRTVNITLGLPFIRTSPDHGTALNIAGQNCANPESFIQALLLASQLIQ